MLAVILSVMLITTQLEQLLEKKDIFSLNEIFEKEKHGLSETERLYFQAHISSSFNDLDQSEECVQKIFNLYTDSLSEKKMTDIMLVHATNMIKMFRYADAADTYIRLKEEYSDALDKDEIEEIENGISVWNAVRDVKPQQIFLEDIDSLKYFQNKFNHIMIPVSANNISEDFIFDSGANISTISNSMAKKMGIRQCDASFETGTSTGSKISSGIGYIDEIKIGKIVFRNVLFIILPDDMLTFEHINYSIKGIIGFPIMYQMGEIKINKNGNITINNKNTENFPKNIYYNELMPIIVANSENGDLLSFCIDTGANNSELGYKFYKKHEDFIKANATEEEKKRGGAGGVIETKTFILPNFKINIGSQEHTFSSISVETDEYEFSKNRDGNLGMDIINSYQETIINFRDMYLIFK